MQSIDQRSPGGGVVRDQLLDGFGVKLDAGVFRLFSRLCDETAGNAKQIRRFDQLDGAPLNGGPFLIGSRLPLFGARQADDRCDGVPQHIGLADR